MPLSSSWVCVGDGRQSQHSLLPLLSVPGIPMALPVGFLALLEPSTCVPSQASRRACVTSSSASGTISPLPPPSRMATCSCGTSAGPTATRGCSRPTMGPSSAVTGTQRTGECGAGPHQPPGLQDKRDPKNRIGILWGKAWTVICYPLVSGAGMLLEDRSDCCFEHLGWCNSVWGLFFDK